MDRVSSNSPSNTFYSYFIETPLQRVEELAYIFFSNIENWFSPPEEFSDVESGRFQSDRLIRDKEIWKKIMDPIEKNIDLASVHPTSPHGLIVRVGDKLPLLTVKLPRRQIIRFPDEIKNKLLNISEDKLDLYCIIYEKPDEEREEFKLRLPDWGEVCNPMVGFYGGTGVSRGGINSIPWHFIREYRYQIGDFFEARMRGDVGAFCMGAYLFDCGGPSQGVGVYGLVVSKEGRGKLIREALIAGESLQDFIEIVGSDLSEIFKFNPHY